MEYIGQNIRRIRIEKRLSQRQLGERIGVSNMEVYRWEAGSRFPRMKDIRKIAEALETTPDELLKSIN